MELLTEPYCWFCGGYGYHQFGELSAHNGFLQCLVCGCKQRRPKEDYDPDRRRTILKDYPKRRRAPMTNTSIDKK